MAHPAILLRVAPRSASESRVEALLSRVRGTMAQLRALASLRTGNPGLLRFERELEGFAVVHADEPDAGLEQWLYRRASSLKSFADSNDPGHIYRQVRGKALDLAQEPSLPWLNAIHRLVKESNLTRLRGATAPSQTFAILGHDASLSNLDSLLREGGRQLSPDWLAEVMLSLDRLVLYREGNDLVQALVQSLILERLGLTEFPPYTLFGLTARLCRLNGGSTDGEPPRESSQRWIEGYLGALAHAIAKTQSCEVDRLKLAHDETARLLDMKTSTVVTFRLHAHLSEQPVVSCSNVTEHFGVTKPTANRAIAALCEASVLTEVTGKQRDRLFAHNRLIALYRRGLLGS